VDAIHAPGQQQSVVLRASHHGERIGLFLDKVRKGGVDLATPEKTVLFDRLDG
jgi:hypothetical protein